MGYKYIVSGSYKRLGGRFREDSEYLKSYFLTNMLYYVSDNLLAFLRVSTCSMAVLSRSNWFVSTPVVIDLDQESSIFFLKSGAPGLVRLALPTSSVPKT